MSSTSRLTHLECSEGCGTFASSVYGSCPQCRAPLSCRYDLVGLRRDDLAGPLPGVFGWQALLPVRDPAVCLSLHEGGTPLVPLPRLAEELGLASLHVKDEARNPLGSFKARGLAVALAAHVERGAVAITLPSAGNAGGAAAAYARRHDIPCRVVLPTAASPTYRTECRLNGARVIAVAGDLGAAGRWVAEHPGGDGDHVIATFAEPFRVEGKKTMGFELWRELGEDLPDAIVYPTGGGTGLVAMAKAFDELREAGLLQAASPRLVAAQVDGCPAVTRAFDAGAPTVAPIEGSRRTLAEGLRVPRLAGGRLVMKALAETNGLSKAVDEAGLIEAIRWASRTDGVLLSPEGAVALAALREVRRDGHLEGARVVTFNTMSAYKCPEALAAAG